MATVIRSPQVNQKRRRLAHAEEQTDGSTAINREADAASVENQSSAQRQKAVEDDREALKGQIDGLRNAVSAAEERAGNAEQALDTLNSGLEKSREQAVTEGFQSGYEKGETQARDQHRDRLAALNRLLESLEAKQGEVARESEDLIVEIVYAAVAKIIGETLSQPSAIREIVHHTINEMGGRDSVVVYLSPDDYGLLDLDDDPLFKDSSVISKIIPDGRVSPGGCILETEKGTLDARLELQLRKLKETLIKHRKQRSGGERQSGVE